MRALVRSFIAVSVVVVLFAAGGCAPTSRIETPVDPPTVSTTTALIESFKGTIIFDTGHGEIFGAEDTSELGQSQAIARMQAAGFKVELNEDTIDDQDLIEAAGLILAGPMRPLSTEEYSAITSFVERGGTVLLTIHVPFPVLLVPAHWGLPVGTDIVMSQRPVAGPAEPSVFAADKISSSPITQGVSNVVVVSGWPVTAASENAALVVETGDDSWLASAGDQAPEPPEGTEFASYGVVGVTSIGKGLIVVSGDDAIFANLALGHGDNARLLDNIISLMSKMNDI